IRIMARGTSFKTSKWTTSSSTTSSNLCWTERCAWTSMPRKTRLRPISRPIWPNSSSHPICPHRSKGPTTTCSKKYCNWIPWPWRSPNWGPCSQNDRGQYLLFQLLFHLFGGAEDQQEDQGT